MESLSWAGLLAVVLGFSVAFSPRVYSAETETPQAKVEFFLAGMKAARQKLRAGLFHAHGIRSVKNPPGSKGKDINGDIRVFGAFDYDANRYRMDRDWPTPDIWHPSSQDKIVTLTTKYCVRPDLSLHYTSALARLEIHKPDMRNPTSLPDAAVYLDVRALGVCFFSYLFREADYEAALKRFLPKTPPVDCRDEGAGVYRVVWDATENERVEWWIDTDHGYTPIRMERRRRTPELGEKGWSREPFQTHEVSWKEISGAWVPSSYRIFYRDAVRPEVWPPPPGTKFTPLYRESDIKLAFDWQSVNQPVADSYFDYQDFDLPDGTYIGDGRSGELVILEMLGSPDATGSRSSPSAHPFTWTVGRAMILVGNILVIVFVATMLWRRRKSGRMASP